jgi:hypothetical protein
MAPRKAKTAAKALSRGAAPTRRKKAALLDILPIRTIAVVAGVAGLAALGVALFGPRRLRDEVLIPFSNATTAAIAPQADRVWAETQPWREHVARLLSSINTEEVRVALADRLSHWVERFR